MEISVGALTGHPELVELAKTDGANGALSDADMTQWNSVNQVPEGERKTLDAFVVDPDGAGPQTPSFNASALKSYLMANQSAVASVVPAASSETESDEFFKAGHMKHYLGFTGSITDRDGTAVGDEIFLFGADYHFQHPLGYVTEGEAGSPDVPHYFFNYGLSVNAQGAFRNSTNEYAGTDSNPMQFMRIASGASAHFDWAQLTNLEALREISLATPYAAFEVRADLGREGVIFYPGLAIKAGVNVIQAGPVQISLAYNWNHSFSSDDESASTNSGASATATAGSSGTQGEGPSFWNEPGTIQLVVGFDLTKANPQKK